MGRFVDLVGGIEGGRHQDLPRVEGAERDDARRQVLLAVGEVGAVEDRRGPLAAVRLELGAPLHEAAARQRAELQLAALRRARCPVTAVTTVTTVAAVAAITAVCPRLRG